MKLKEFRIQNYRSVNDSGIIQVDEQLALVGRNESGKTNLLKALASLNPAEGVVALSFIKDFPRDREVDDYTPELRVVDSIWQFSEAEIEQLTDLLPRAHTVTEVSVGRDYHATRFVGFVNLAPLVVEQTLVNQALAQLRRSVVASLRQRGDDNQVSVMETSLQQLTDALQQVEDAQSWAEQLDHWLDAYRTAAAEAAFAISTEAENALTELATHGNAIRNDRENQLRAMNQVIEWLPTFLYLSDIPEMDGHHNLADFARRLHEKRPNEADLNFNKLAKVAGFDPLQLLDLQQHEYQRRQQLINRAGTSITKNLQRLWSDRPIKVRFNLDGDHFDILVSDPTAMHDLEVNLNERSRGFRWFFSLYVNLAAEAIEQRDRPIILLLDEPGLHLHALGQRDLMHHFGAGFQGQIIYTTHSPFMIPVGKMHQVRTVNYESELGSRCYNRPQGDARTLYPIQVALAYSTEDGLFGEQPLLMVATLSDYLYLSAMASYFALCGEPALPDEIAIVPMGGLDRAVYLLSTFAGEDDGVLLLVNDSDPRWSILQPLVASQDAILSLSSLLPDAASGAGMEDLFGNQHYHALITETYGTKLRRSSLLLDAAIPGLVFRYRQAFAQLGHHFDPTKIATLLMRRILQDRETLMSTTTLAYFGQLFAHIRQRLD